MKSAIYEGTVQHVRSAPVAHAFSYRLFLLYLDLDELPQVFAGTRWWRNERSAPASFRRRDYLPGDLPLAEAARGEVERLLGFAPTGPVRVLTQLRYFGLCFNPVSFYYCFDRDGALAAVLAEITNTPWRERHCYAVDCRGRAVTQVDFAKRFHISPFMPMAQRYAWTFAAPGERLSVAMVNHQDGQPVFSAGLDLARQPITAGALDRLLVRFPFMTLRVLAGIHIQAVQLWWKGVPFFSHPASAPNTVPQPLSEVTSP